MDPIYGNLAIEFFYPRRRQQLENSRSAKNFVFNYIIKQFDRLRIRVKRDKKSNNEREEHRQFGDLVPGRPTSRLSDGMTGLSLANSVAITEPHVLPPRRFLVCFRKDTTTRAPSEQSHTRRPSCSCVNFPHNALPPCLASESALSASCWLAGPLNSPCEANANTQRAFGTELRTRIGRDEGWEEWGGLSAEKNIGVFPLSAKSGCIPKARVA